VSITSCCRAIGNPLRVGGCLCWWRSRGRLSLIAEVGWIATAQPRKSISIAPSTTFMQPRVRPCGVCRSAQGGGAAAPRAAEAQHLHRAQRCVRVGCGGCSLRSVSCSFAYRKHQAVALEINSMYANRHRADHRTPRCKPLITPTPNPPAAVFNPHDQAPQSSTWTCVVSAHPLVLSVRSCLTHSPPPCP